MKIRLTLIIILTLLVSFTISAKVFAVDYFDNDCYNHLCRNISLYDYQKEKCIFEPIINEDESFSGNVKYDAVNSEELLGLSEEVQNYIHDIFLECVKRNQTVVVKLQDESGKKAIKNLIKGSFYLFVLPLIIVVAIVLSIFLIWDILSDRRKNKNKKKKVGGRFFYFG